MFAWQRPTDYYCYKLFDFLENLGVGEIADNKLKVFHRLKEKKNFSGKLILSGKCHGILNALKCGNPELLFKIRTYFVIMLHDG